MDLDGATLVPLNTEDSMPKRSYDISELKAAGGPGRTVAYAEIRSGRLKARKIGRRTVVLAEDLDAYLASLPEAGANRDSEGK